MCIGYVLGQSRWKAPRLKESDRTGSIGNLSRARSEWYNRSRPCMLGRVVKTFEAGDITRGLAEEPDRLGGRFARSGLPPMRLSSGDVATDVRPTVKTLYGPVQFKASLAFNPRFSSILSGMIRVSS